MPRPGLLGWSVLVVSPLRDCPPSQVSLSLLPPPLLQLLMLVAVSRPGFKQHSWI